MTPSTDYKRGYRAGRQARDRLAYERDSRRDAEALAVAKRAERAETAAGIGHCQDCRNWTRPDGCSWGYCEASRQPGSPWGCWAQPASVSNYDKGRISTTPMFGCVLFADRDEALKEIGNG